MKRARLAAVLLLPLALIAGAEAYSRYWLGLGDPPLTIVDTDVEYLFKPGCYSRFGNRICYNAESMRSEPMPAASPGMRRYLVAGDSVINGGSLIDQRNTATERAQADLRAEGGRVWIGNLSAGSWGPGNILAYFRTRGWPELDGVILVLSSHDLLDVPQFSKDLGADFPQRKPFFAIEEVMMRYLPRYLPDWLSSRRADDAAGLSPDETIKQGTALFSALLQELSQNVPKTVLVLHPEEGELRNGRRATAAAMQAIAERAALPSMVTDPWLLASPQPGHFDYIHLNATGHAIYARLIACLIRNDLEVEPCRQP